MLDGLIYCYQRNMDYVAKLGAGLDDKLGQTQPLPRMNHPAWILSHLNIYHNVMACIVEGRSFPDPKDGPFGMGSAPDRPSAPYLPIASLLENYGTGARTVLELLSKAQASVLDNPIPLPRWQERMPTAARALPYLMLVHENQHLGQFSAWRRAAGLPSA